MYIDALLAHVHFLEICHFLFTRYFLKETVSHRYDVEVDNKSKYLSVSRRLHRLLLANSCVTVTVTMVQVQLPPLYIRDNFTNQARNDNGGIDCVVALSQSGKIEVMRGNVDMKSSLLRYQYDTIQRANVDSKHKLLGRALGHLEKAQTEFNDEFNGCTMIALDKLRSPQFSPSKFEELKKALIMYSALKSVPRIQFVVEPATLGMAVTATNDPSLNAAMDLYRSSMEDLRKGEYRKHANKTSALSLTRKDKNNSLEAIVHGLAKGVKTLASQALDDDHEMTGDIKKGLGIAVNAARYNTKKERVKRSNDAWKEERKEYDRKRRQEKKQAEYDEYLGGVSWGELYKQTVEEMAVPRTVETVVYRK